MKYKKTINMAMMMFMLAMLIPGALAASPLTISSPNDNEFIKGTENIVWTGDKNPFTVDFNDGSGFSTICGSTGNNYCNWDTTLETDGEYLLRVTDTNSEKDSVNITIDNTAPTGGNITAPNGGEVLGTTTTISWNTITEVNYNHTEIYYNYSGTGFTLIDTVTSGNTYTWNISSLTDATTYLVKVVHVDKAGNSVEDISDSVFEIDNTAPTHSSDLSVDKTMYAAGDTITLTWTPFTDANMGNVTTQYYNGSDWIVISGNTANDGSDSFTAPALNRDDIKVRVIGHDTSSTINSASQDSSTFIIDNVNPINSDATPVQGYISSDLSQTVTINLTDDNSGINESTIDFTLSGTVGGVTNIGTSHANLTFSGDILTFSNGVLGADGETITVTVDVDDNVGNAMTTKTWSFVIDSRVPNVVLDSPADDVWLTSSSQALKFTPTTAGYAGTDTCVITINNEVNDTINITDGSQATLSAQNFADGTYVWNANCTRLDNGLFAEASSDFTFNVDTVNPTLSLTTTDTTINSDFTVSISLTDATSGLDNDTVCKVESSINAGPYSTWENLSAITDGDTSYSLSKNYNTSSLSDGDVINFKLNCNDVAGNSGTQQTLSVTYDLSAPNTYGISLNKYDVWNNETIDVTATVTSSNTLDTVTAYINGYTKTLTHQGNNVYSASIYLPDASVTSNNQTELYVVAVDVFGNSEVQDEDNTLTFKVTGDISDSYVNQGSMITLIENYWKGITEATSNLYLKATEIANLYYNKTEVVTLIANDGDYDALSDLPSNVTLDSEWDTIAKLESILGVNIVDTTELNYTVDTDTQLNESQVDAFVSNNGYLTSYTETDPSFTAWDKSTGINISEAQIYDLVHTVDTDTQLNESQVDAFVSNNGYLTSYTETDPVWTADSVNYYNKTQVDNKSNELENKINALESDLNETGSNIQMDDAGFGIKLVKGWGQFKLPSFVLTGNAHTDGLNLTGNYSVTNVLSSINGSYDYLAYDKGDGQWMVNVPGNSTATTFVEFPHATNDPDYTFHIHMTKTDTLEVGSN